jgi:hypothetical protein
VLASALILSGAITVLVPLANAPPHNSSPLASIRTTGLVAEWKFDKGTGTTAYDTSGNNNRGTIYGAQWTTGVSGAALEFDGVDDYVRFLVIQA